MIAVEQLAERWECSRAVRAEANLCEAGVPSNLC